MVRVIYLLDKDIARRTQLIDESVSGKKWSRVTDKEMVDLSQNLQGWTRSVYKFGCSFIHLSALHDYNDRDPLELLAVQERSDILDHCRQYHGGPMQDARFGDLLPFLPRVLEKIAGNLDEYLGALERGETLNQVF